ncbi:MAG: hypothetical protein EBZ77_12890 [Chitinophagia bacterium]|nr:hypothetical protein [Chitinophagia bacterium]
MAEGVASTVGELAGAPVSGIWVRAAQADVPVHRLVLKPLQVLDAPVLVVDELLHERVLVRHSAEVLVGQKDPRVVCALRVQKPFLPTV